MSSGNQNLPHTAITTWSGYIYQGKTALYHVVRLLCENRAEVENYVLQLDSLDDFAILSGKDIVSLHQVKALKKQLYSSYKAALDDLKSKSTKHNSENVFLHIAKEINDKDIQDIESEVPPVKIYKYRSDEYWCSLNDIDREIEKLILLFFELNFSAEQWRIDNGYSQKTRNFLEQIILKKVIQIHNIVHESIKSDREAAYAQTIDFSQFITILTADLNQEKLGDDYYFYVLLSDLNRYYQEYCIELGEENETVLMKLSAYMHTIENLDSVRMCIFIRNIIPHRDFKFDSLRAYKDSTFNRDEIQGAFLRILEELKEAKFEETKNFFFWKVENNHFSPTAINAGESQETKICNKIIENALNTDLDIMFEKNNLITADINVVSIGETANNISEINIGNDKKIEERITKWKSVSLKSLKNVKKEING